MGRTIMRDADADIQCPFCQTRGQVETTFITDVSRPGRARSSLRRLAAARPPRIQGVSALCRACGFIWRAD